MLLTPGPVKLHPEVLKTLSLPMIHHRTPEFDAILKRVLVRLKSIFQTEQNCYMLSSTGSGGMECLLVNVLSPEDTVLCINSGKFGERWEEMASTFGAKVITHKVPWGESVEVSEIEELLKKNPNIKIVLCQATETSTGTAHPIKEIAQLISKNSEILFLVDGITALGAYPIQMDAWGIDGLVGGSQKAFMLPTGMSFVSFSKKAWGKIKQNKIARFYFDIRNEEKSNAKGETFFSSNVALIRALDKVLDIILNNGLENHFAELKKRAEFNRKFMPKLSLALFSNSPSISVTALSTPNHIDSQKLRQHLEDKYNITIMGGQDQLKGKIIRIGHMGYIEDYELVKCLESVGNAMRDLDPNIFSKQHLDFVVNEAQSWLKTNFKV